MYAARFPDPMSTSAVLALRIAMTGVLATAIAAVATRFDYLDGHTG